MEPIISIPYQMNGEIYWTLLKHLLHQLTKAKISDEAIKNIDKMKKASQKTTAKTTAKMNIPTIQTNMERVQISGEIHVESIVHTYKTFINCIVCFFVSC